MKEFIYLILGIFYLADLHAQNGLIGSGFGSNNWTVTDNFSNSVGGSMIFSTRANGTGNQYFRTVSSGLQQSPSFFCTPGQDQIISTGNPYTAANSNCTNGAWYLNVPNTSDEYIFKTPSPTSNQFVLFRIQGSVRNVSTVNQSPGLVFPSQSVTINATVSGPLATGQSVYLRYSNNNWASSTVQEMTLSGSYYISTIPSTINQAGTTIRYYVFTSGPGLPINHSNSDWYTINLNNNGGSNFSYTVQDEWTTRTGGDGTWDDPNMWDAFQVPPSDVPVRIQDNIILDINATVSSLKIDPNAIFTGSDLIPRTLYFSNGGIFENNGFFNSAQGNIHFLGFGNISGTVNFNNIFTEGGLDFGSNSTVNGKFTILNGGFVISNSCTYATNSTLEFNTGGNYNLSFNSLSWDNSNTPHNINVSGGTTIYLYDDFTRVVNGNLSIDSFSKIIWQPSGFDNGLLTIFGNLNLTRDAEFSVSNGDGSNAFTNNINLEGNLIIDASSRFALNSDIGDDLSIAGNIINQNIFFSNNRLVTLNGNSPQYLTGNFIGINSFHYLETNNSSGIFLNDNIYIEDELRMSSGHIYIQNSDLILGPSTAILGTFTSNNMIVPSSTGTVVKELNNTGTFFFPVGDNDNGAEYSPVSINLIAANFGSLARISLNLKDEKHPNNPSTINYLTRHWTVEAFDISNYLYDIEFNYDDNDIFGSESLIEEIKSSDNGLNWDYFGIVNEALNKITLFNQNSFSVFTGGENYLLSTELISFHVDLVNNHAICNWTTAEEKNCEFFELEHYNSNFEWQKVATISANGSSFNEYNSIHQYPHVGINYYRLKIVNKDQSSNYSRIEAITLDDINDFYFWWLTNNSIRIRLKSLNDESVNLKLFDSSAKLIWNKSGIQLQNGIAIIDFDSIEIPKFSILSISVGNKVVKTIQIIKP